MFNLNKKIIIPPIFILITLIISSFLLYDDQRIATSEQNEYPLITYDTSFENDNPIKIGIIHSLTGTMAISEKPVVDATLLAISEINKSGGLLGRELVPIIKNGDSNWNTFKESAEELITVEEVDVVFGGWTSASRKTMLPVFEKYDHLLFYPVQYEGLESSSNIIYTGAAPNQQVLPAVEWAYNNLGTTFFLIGSDYVFPRSANEIIKFKLKELGGEILGEKYRILGATDFKDVVNEIIEKQPDVILNTINGDSNTAFFAELREQGVSPNNIPTISFSLSEGEIETMSPDDVIGDYASWNYFQSIDNKLNRDFVTNFKNQFGKNRVIDDPMEAAYFGVYLYAKAVEKAGTTDIPTVRQNLKGLSLLAPEGSITIHPENQHTAKAVRIGKILPDGQFEIVYSSQIPISPIPYPNYKTEEEWNTFLDNLYYGWDKNWANLEKG